MTKIATQKTFELIDDVAIPKTLAVAVAGVARSTYYRWRQIARSTNPSQEQQRKSKYIKLTDRNWIKDASSKLFTRRHQIMASTGQRGQ
jgi:ACT domain-containing protein